MPGQEWAERHSKRCQEKDHPGHQGFGANSCWVKQSSHSCYCTIWPFVQICLWGWNKECTCAKGKDAASARWTSAKSGTACSSVAKTHAHTNLSIADSLRPRPQAVTSAGKKRSQRLSQIKTLEDGLMAKVFFLLQKLTPSRRLKLLKESFSQPHRLALEAWVLAQKKGQRHLSLAEPANTGSQCGPEAEESQQTGTMAAETLAIADAEVEQVQQIEPAPHDKIRQPRAANAMRGIASFQRRGTVFYQVSVCVQSFCMTARKVKDLDRAVDILLILMTIKQKVGRVLTAFQWLVHPYPLSSSQPVSGAALFFFQSALQGIVEPDLFAKKMADTVPAVLEEHGVTAEEWTPTCSECKPFQLHCLGFSHRSTCHIHRRI